MAWFKKKNKDDEIEQDHLDLVDDYKEPFSWAVFWDEKIVLPAQKIRRFLDNRGIMAFVTSPFQYRNRLIIKLLVIMLGVLIGIVPRSLTLIDENKARNAASEFSQIEDKIFTVNSIKVKPLASGQYKKKHVLVFSIMGDAIDGVSSKTEDYDVSFEAYTGVSDADKVSYRYQIIPVNLNSRLLVIYTDNSKQNDTDGTYVLYTKLKSEDVRKPVPIEVILSDSQETTDIFKNGIINLSALSPTLSGDPSGKRPIEDAEAALEASKLAYKNVYDAATSIEGVSVEISPESLDLYVEKFSTYKGVTDDTTTKELSSVENVVKPAEDEELVGTAEAADTYVPVVHSRLSVKAEDGVVSTYSTDDQTQPQAGTIEAEYLPALDKAMKDVLQKVGSLNSLRKRKYDDLESLKRTLNRNFDPEDMVDGGSVVRQRKQEKE